MNNSNLINKEEKIINESGSIKSDYCIGIEFECFYNREDLDNIEEHFQKNGWTREHDGSIKPNDTLTETSSEFISPIIKYTPSNILEIKKVLIEAYNLGCRTNSSCSTHTHFSIKFKSVKSFKKERSEKDIVNFNNLYNRIYRLYFIKSLINSKYYNKIKNLSFDESNETWSSKKYASIHQIEEQANYIINNINDEDKILELLSGESFDKYSLIRLHDYYCTLEWRGIRGIFNFINNKEDIEKFKNKANNNISKYIKEIDEMIKNMILVYTNNNNNIIPILYNVSKLVKSIVKKNNNFIISVELFKDIKWNLSNNKTINNYKELINTFNVEINTENSKEIIISNKEENNNIKIINSNISFDYDMSLIFKGDISLENNNITKLNKLTLYNNNNKNNIINGIEHITIKDKNFGNKETNNIFKNTSIFMHIYEIENKNIYSNIIELDNNIIKDSTITTSTIYNNKNKSNNIEIINSIIDFDNSSYIFGWPHTTTLTLNNSTIKNFNNPLNIENIITIDNTKNIIDKGTILIKLIDYIDELFINNNDNTTIKIINSLIYIDKDIYMLLSKEDRSKIKLNNNNIQLS